MSENNEDTPREIYLNTVDDYGFVVCDGCRKEIQPGTAMLIGIVSCCGGGCCRGLCRECVTYAALLFADADAKADEGGKS